MDRKGKPARGRAAGGRAALLAAVFLLTALLAAPETADAARARTGTEGVVCAAPGQAAAVSAEGAYEAAVLNPSDGDLSVLLTCRCEGSVSAPPAVTADGEALETAVSAPGPESMGPETSTPGGAACVYRFAGCRSTSADTVLAVEFRVDPARTAVLTYGFSAAETDAAAGLVRCTLPVDGGEGTEGYIVLLGEDLNAYDVFGYADGVCAAPGDRDGVEASCVRYETDIGCLTQAFSALELGESAAGAAAAVGAEVRAAVCGGGGERLYSGPLEPVIREAAARKRALTLTFRAEVPARSGVHVRVGS